MYYYCTIDTSALQLPQWLFVSTDDLHGIMNSRAVPSQLWTAYVNRDRQCKGKGDHAAAEQEAQLGGHIPWAPPTFTCKLQRRMKTTLNLSICHFADSKKKLSFRRSYSLPTQPLIGLPISLWGAPSKEKPSFLYIRATLRWRVGKECQKSEWILSKSSSATLTAKTPGQAPMVEEQVSCSCLVLDWNLTNSSSREGMLLSVKPAK